MKRVFNLKVLLAALAVVTMLGSGEFAAADPKKGGKAKVVKGQTIRIPVGYCRTCGGLGVRRATRKTRISYWWTDKKTGNRRLQTPCLACKRTGLRFAPVFVPSR